ncbi:accessory gene regulator ArgB-like protein [Paenibacillus sp. EKM211P]|uniref:accessory gene regulator ArgB-like protein n=1 Tax=Paenibacillus sp. EKM211P TaxID=1683679 RepID=UPI0013E900AC|nr:accessory gene regulator B family protein [Paenibacillus sp. EKM211P]KAF6585026.1 accessory gene regulator B family protein [Paenibacillus sp. EKM211P]
MIEALSNKIAIHIKSVVPDHPASVPVLKHALAITLNVIFITGLSILISLITGRVKEVVTIMAAFAFLRQMTGGVHLKSGMSCVAVSTLLFTALSFISLDHKWTMIATIISMLLILIFAPAGIENQTRIPKRYFPLLKVAALVTLGLNLWFALPYVAISFFAQTLLLINGGRWKTS